jgi:anaerobic selenocysteine-containing dehydrogenase
MLNKAVINTCPRWKAQLDFIYHPERLLQPLKRIGQRGDGAFKPVSWDEALDTVATSLQKIKDEYGAESVVFYISFPKEPRPYLRRLAFAFGSPNYCTESSNCATAAMLADSLNYGPGSGAMPAGPMSIDPLAKCQLVWGSGVRQSSPEQWNDYLAAKKNGLKFITVDPRRTSLAAMSDIHLQLRPGSDGALALGIMNVIVKEQLYDREFVEKWTVGFQALKELVQEYPPERVEQITWVPAAKVREAAVMYATRKPAGLQVSPCTIVQCSNGVQNQRAILLLPALTGNISIPGESDGMPSGPRMNDISLRERLASLPAGFGAALFPIWTGMFQEMQSNLLAACIESNKPYPLKALFGAGINTTFFPNTNRLVASLKKLDFIVITEYFHTAATRLADVVLPISSWLERTILETNPLNGHIRLIEPAIEPVGETWPEWEIIAELAKRLGLGDYFWNGDFEKCLNYILAPLNITVDDLRRHTEGMPANPRPAKHRQPAGFRTPSGKIEIASSILAQHGHKSLPVYQEPAESPLSRPDLARSFPLVLTTGGRTVVYTHSQYRNISRLRRMVPEPQLEINPADATPRGIQSGDIVTVSSPRGSIKLKAKVTDTILAGVVHAPHHWPGDANINILTDDSNLDPISGFAPFKSQLCQVTKL